MSRLLWCVRMGYLFPALEDTSIHTLGTFVSLDLLVGYRKVWLVAVCLGRRSYRDLVGT